MKPAQALCACLLALLPTSAGAAGLVPVAVDQAAVDRSMAPRKLALLIGVSAYDDPLFTPLSFAQDDARSMAEVLGNDAFGGFDEVRSITSQDETTADAVEAALDDLLDRAGPDDTVLVYVSGHGTLGLDWQQQPELYLVATDTRADDLPRTALLVRELQDRIAESAAKRRVLIIDACHHGAGKSKVAPETIARLRGIKGPASPILRTPESGFEAHLFASTFGLPALEDVSLGHGVYTHYLLQAMSDEAVQADRDSDGLVSVSEAHDFARDHTVAHTAAVQVPRAEYKIVGREQIFLSGDEDDRKQAEQALLYSFDDYYLRCSVTVDGEDRGLLPRGIALLPGEHDVVVSTPGGEVIASRKVPVTAGEVVDVRSLHTAQRPERWRIGGAGGVLSAFGDQDQSPYGGALGGLAVHAGFSFPGRKPARAHVRLDGSWHAGRHEVGKGGTRFTASVHALRLHATPALHVRAGRFGLVVGPTAGLLVALRFPAEGLGPASPHLVTWEAGLRLEPSVSITDRLAVSLGAATTLTGADLSDEEPRTVVVYGQVHGGLTWTH